MTTETAIVITQLPIAIGVLWLAFELHLLRKKIEKVN